jgi:hypothetical protein
MKTVQDVIDLISANARSTNEQLAKHAATLIGPRQHGSTTELGLDSIPPETPILPYMGSNLSPGCVAYCFESDAIGAKLGAIPLMHADMLGMVIEERDGIHGKELVGISRIGKSIRLFETDQITVIIGEFAGEQAVFTWHPGLPLVPGVDRSNRFTAVKLV